jgi:hypothetical protein
LVNIDVFTPHATAATKSPVPAYGCNKPPCCFAAATAESTGTSYTKKWWEKNASGPPTATKAATRSFELAIIATTTEPARVPCLRASISSVVPGTAIISRK